MTRYFLIILILLCTSSIYSQTVWENNFDLPDSTFAIDIQETPDGNFILFGGTFLGTPSPVAFLLKFSENGEGIWMNSYPMNPIPGEQDPLSYPRHIPKGSLIQAQNGDLVICGETIIRTNQNGNQIWTIDSPARDITETADGTLISIHYNIISKYSPEGGGIRYARYWT